MSNFIKHLDISLLNGDTEVYELLNSLEMMNVKGETNYDDELISITSAHVDNRSDESINDATRLFLEAAFQGDRDLLTTLYKSGTKVRM